MIKKVLSSSFGLFLIFALAFSVASIAKANPPISVNGSVKTVLSCGQQGNTNEFDAGQTVKGEGNNFDDNSDYRWTVVKVDQPGKDTQVSSGNFHLGNYDNDFCIVIYEPAQCTANDNHSEYKWEVEKKVGGSWHKVDSDNFFVSCEEEPLDLCTNLPGNQETMPQGYEDPDQDKICTEIPIDLCCNLEGIQTEMPQGYEDPDQDKVCTEIPVDLCTNIDGIQTEIPQGYEDPDQDKICTPVDLCNNLAGVQTSLLPGVVRLDDGSCISYGKSSPKPTITPTVLGTVAPAVGGTTENLPVSGGNDMSLYYLAIIAALGTTYYMKVAGWKKFVGNR